MCSLISCPSVGAPCQGQSRHLQMHLPSLPPSSAVKLQFKWSRRTGGLVLFSILYFSTCQVLIDWLRWIRNATLLQRVCERAAYIYKYMCVCVCREFMCACWRSLN